VTLQGWAFFVLASLIAFLNWGANAQTMGPSVWEQMQSASNAPANFKATVVALQVSGQQVSVDLISVTNSWRYKGLKLCSTAQFPTAPSDQRVDILSQALRSKNAVEIGLSGPFNPCLDTIRVSR